jgi:hypothetical protein
VELYLHFPNTPSRRGSQLKKKHSDNFTLPSRSLSMLCGSLSPRHGASSACGWRWRPNIENVKTWRYFVANAHKTTVRWRMHEPTTRIVSAHWYIRQCITLWFVI